MKEIHFIFPAYTIETQTKIGALIFEPLVVDACTLAVSHQKYKTDAEKASIIKAMKQVWAIISYIDYVKNPENQPVAPIVWGDIQPHISVDGRGKQSIDCHASTNINQYTKLVPTLIWLCISVSATDKTQKINYLYQGFCQLYQLQGQDMRASNQQIIAELIDYIDKNRIQIEEEYEEAVAISVPQLSQHQMQTLEALFLAQISTLML